MGDLKKQFVSIIIILFFSVLLSLPLLKSGLYTMHDDQQIARLFLFHKALSAGQFPPRWVDGLGFGFGYPLFVFYPPLSYFIGEVIHIIGFGFIDSVKMVFFLSIFLSGLAMFIFSRKLFGNFAALISSLFYLLAPYRALDVYVRGALAESLSFIWPPLIFWSVIKIYQQRNIRSIIISAVSLAGLMVTHNLIFMPFIAFWIIFIAYLSAQTNKKINFLTLNIASLSLSLAISAFFWAPAIIEKRFTIVDDLLLVNLANYKIHFVYLSQLWNWTWGFGGSTEGIMDGISFKVGKLHILISCLAFIFSIINLIVRRKTNNNFLYLTTLAFSFMLLFSVFMTTNFSKLIWDLIKPIAYLQFPWRFLAFTAFFTSLLAGSLIHQLRITVLKIVFATIIVGLVIFTNLKLFSPQYYRENLTDLQATSPETINWDVSSSSFEYLPKGVKLIKNEKGANSVDINKNDIPHNIVEQNDLVKISNVTSQPGHIKFTAQSKEKTKININSSSFPGWKVYINGLYTPYNNDNKYKLININLNEGISDVELKFTNTPVRFYSNLITLIAILAIMVYLSKIWRILIHKLT